MSRSNGGCSICLFVTFFKLYPGSVGLFGDIKIDRGNHFFFPDTLAAMAGKNQNRADADVKSVSKLCVNCKCARSCSNGALILGIYIIYIHIKLFSLGAARQTCADLTLWRIDEVIQ